MSEHTKGPWSLTETASGWMVDGPDRMPVCSPASTRGLRSEAELNANAYLIAGSVDLLEALEAFTNTFESAKPFELLADLSKAYEQARAALKKAKP